MPLLVNLSLSWFMASDQAIPLQFAKVMQVFAIVLLPVALGMLIRHFAPAFAARMEKPMKLVAALFFTALDDQAKLRDSYLADAKTTQEGVHALVHSYVDWVDSQPEWARFQFHARFAVTKGPLKDELVARNKSRNRQLLEWLAAPGRGDELQRVPAELMPSLIIGQAESYCRAWLSGRVQSSPKTYRDVLAEAAWRSIGGE